MNAFVRVAELQEEVTRLRTVIDAINDTSRHDHGMIPIDIRAMAANALQKGKPQIDPDELCTCGHPFWIHQGSSLSLPSALDICWDHDCLCVEFSLAPKENT